MSPADAKNIRLKVSFDSDGDCLLKVKSLPLGLWGRFAVVDVGDCTVIFHPHQKTNFAFSFRPLRWRCNKKLVICTNPAKPTGCTPGERYDLDAEGMKSVVTTLNEALQVEPTTNAVRFGDEQPWLGGTQLPVRLTGVWE